MKNFNLLAPQALPFKYEDWKNQNFTTRVKMLCTAWATQGYGAPVSVYTFYLLKIGLYIWAWTFFCSFSVGLGAIGTIESWWFAPEALAKAIVWSILFENLGLGCGSGPLTARYFPPIASVLHFVRPGTVKLPAWPGIPIFGGDKRSWLDVLLYLAHIGFLIRALIAPELTPELIIPTIILLPILGLTDRTIYLSARAEHYLIALFCFLFPDEALAGNKIVWVAIWWGAATSKLNRHFPAVICVMISNSAVLRIPWLRKKIYKNYPKDLRPGPLAHFLAHFGTVVEYGFPLILLLGLGGQATTFALIVMFLFHLYITSSIPMGVPLEWNVIMVYGGFVLFGQHAEVWLFDLHSPALVAVLATSLFLVPLIGNYFPKYVSFLLSMRYYAGNWAYSVWLFKGDAEQKLDEHIIKASPTVMAQLANFYGEDTADTLVSKVIAFRSMHLHGRALQLLVPKAVEDIEDYTWRDGELVAGVVLGWNFGDGHLHHELLLQAVQNRCNFDSGELRCIFVESQPMGYPYLAWRIADAKDGQLEQGKVAVKKLLELQPYPS